MAWENDRRDVSDAQQPEAETRRLIDEQLRKAGWEADTQRLRYSKGVRPVRGRNLAIAEWPTDAATGTRGVRGLRLVHGYAYGRRRGGERDAQGRSRRA